jgi:hypothetical protein
MKYHLPPTKPRVAPLSSLSPHRCCSRCFGPPAPPKAHALTSIFFLSHILTFFQSSHLVPILLLFGCCFPFLRDHVPIRMSLPRNEPRDITRAKDSQQITKFSPIRVDISHFPSVRCDALAGSVTCIALQRTFGITSAIRI